MFLAIVATSLVLSVAASTGPLFTTAAGSAALAAHVQPVSRWDAGLTVEGGPLNRLVHLRTVERALDTAGTRYFHDPVLTLVGSKVTASGVATPDVGIEVRVAFRSGFPAQFGEGSSGADPGVWITEAVATELGASPGGSLDLREDGRSARVLVAGVYRDPKWREDFWRPLSDVSTGPPLFLADQAVVMGLERRLGSGAHYVWRFPLPNHAITLRHARRLAGQFEDVETTISAPPIRLASALSGVDESTALLTGLVEQATDMVAGIGTQVDGLARCKRSRAGELGPCT
jgi:hypothetical protein